ncbi:protein insensitive-like [Episyrphus balteatus]|uniref:protein insensitive-like n=1 Tax=Episyrphus balteatus TaxID=286459 RepID=UPI002485D5A0|nr:protein insensitive-like [Episyrphus balteatus]
MYFSSSSAFQPFKKRVVEQQPNYSQPPYDGSQNQRPIQQVQYIQYIPANECNIETLQQSYKQQNQQIRSQLPEQPQIIKIERIEAPMMLNAWTQTNSDDFPPLTTFNEAILMANIKRLEQKLQAQSDMIEKMSRPKTRSPTPVRMVSQQPNIVSELSPIEYRIINKTNLPNNETQIEIEISDDNSKDNIPYQTVPDTLNSEQKENEFVEHMYAQIRSSKSPNSNNAPKVTTTDHSEVPMVSIGPNNTRVPQAEFEKISWSSASIATRKLLGFIFDRETLATHSMTGKASPAFKDLDKPIKRKLESKAIEDIIFVVTTKCGVSAKEVRSAITTKCADENKMLKLKALKNMHAKRSILTENKKNKA